MNWGRVLKAEAWPAPMPRGMNDVWRGKPLFSPREGFVHITEWVSSYPESQGQLEGF